MFCLLSSAGSAPRVQAPSRSLLAAYDYEERLCNPPAPLLFQWGRAGGPSRMTGEFIRRVLAEVLACIGHTDAAGLPL
ncbi:hypothetical protein ACFRJ3_36480 [Streptomyces sp. NPDC056696]|uniref:hypothetical protein n=1 Tax=Streptomyces sp. NPDC056696 TaxID=3345914 RepID=UPI00369B8040